MKTQKTCSPETRISKSYSETFNLGNELGLVIKPPVLIGLSGDLGTGKTVFVKGIASALKVQELVTSPTFLGISEYYSGKFPLIHMDFFNKVVEQKLIDVYLHKKSVLVIEWIENFSSVFNKKLSADICVYIKLGCKENEREITVYQVPCFT